MFLFISLFASVAVFAQTGSISGKIANAAGTPLVSATVKIKSTNKATGDK